MTILRTPVAGWARAVAAAAVLVALGSGVVVAIGSTDNAPAAPVPPVAAPAPSAVAEPVDVGRAAVLTDDATVRGGRSADERLGLDEELLVKRGSADVTRVVLLRFALEGIDPGDGDVALLALSDAREPDVLLELRRVDAGWDERTVTWSTRPDSVGQPARVTLRTDTRSAGSWTVDVTGLVRAARADGADVLALQIGAVERTEKPLRCASQEAGDGSRAPRLELHPAAG